MRIVFFGTPQEAVPFLGVCRQVGEVAAVVTAPDRPRGRGRKLMPPPVKEAAVEAGLEVLQPAWCADADFVRRIRELAPDVFVVVAYGQILPAKLLGVPRIALNVHFSLLPQLRGAAPVQRAVQWGFSATGVSVQQMAAKVDAGAVLCQRAVPIHWIDDAAAVRRRLVAVGVECLRDVLGRLRVGQPADGAEQVEEVVTYAPKIQRYETAVDFAAPASVTWRQVRGLADSGGAYCFIEGKRLKLWTGAYLWRSDPGGSPGEIEAAVEEGPVVACGGHYLVVTEAQVEGKKRMTGSELLRGRVLGPGKRLEAAASGSGQTPGG